MKFLATILILTFLTGCATWDGMTTREKHVAVGTAVGAAILGYYANSDDDAVNPHHPPQCYDKHCGR